MALFGIEFRGILIANGAKDSYGYDGYGLKVMNQYGFSPMQEKYAVGVLLFTNKFSQHILSYLLSCGGLIYKN